MCSLFELSNRELGPILAELISRVEGGEEVVLTRKGKPVARMTDGQPAPRPVQIGFGKDLGIQLASDFDEELGRYFDYR